MMSHFKFWTTFVLASLVLSAQSAALASAGQHKFQRIAMGVEVSIFVDTEDAALAEAAALSAFERIAEVEATLERLRPLLRADGGDVRLVSISTEGLVELAWQGACAHCAVSDQTLTAGLEPALRADHNWVREVVID